MTWPIVTIGSGRWRGTKLVNQNPHCHPMGAREKNALFNKLATRLPGAEVLDLFAGTGALGFEAASRGAAMVMLVDQNQANLVDNLDTILNLIARDPDFANSPSDTSSTNGNSGVASNTNASVAPSLAYAPMSVEQFLATQLSQSRPRQYDLILADPPYQQFTRLTPVLVQVAQLLAPGGIYVLSQPADSEPLAIPGLTALSSDTYAGAQLVFYTKTN